ncbi:protein DOWNY MILDEW RESISTANCE 6 [Selaginella moellendorffii]|uniref:protein DOWNY MILDEW RESISTANCE 6 n=1 Tax=Selaginella moellendorffii TaxID=88036 RepID=UPI000D1D12B4|nr:protein DOWNY MILDEW RESISTANCE 6 [Selaginella moellendorffii]|eukprot:XP_024515321.1 protein DOWNY MILDEW RESISTANCE 6 [Selaginella moellendorffii]
MGFFPGKQSLLKYFANCSSQVIGHGISNELMQDIIKMVHYFFNLPAKERMVYYSTDIYKSFRFSTGSIASASKKFWSDYLFQHCQPAVHEDDLPESCHADPGTITVLQQELGVEGLEVNYNGQWIPVKPVEGALVINVADMLQVK